MGSSGLSFFSISCKITKYLLETNVTNELVSNYTVMTIELCNID